MEEKTMTLKEIANVAGVHYNTVYRTAKKVFPMKIKNGKLATFGEIATKKIMEMLPKRNFVTPLQNGEDKPLPNSKAPLMQNLTITDKAIMTDDFIAKIVSETVKAIMPTILQTVSLQMTASKPTVPALIEPKYFTVLGYAIMINHPSRFNNGLLVSISKRCKKYSIAMNIEVREVYDPHYVTVKAYREDVLEKVFEGVEL